MKKVEIEYESDIQYKTLSALAQSMEEGSVNMDKFLMWVMKNYEPGSSIMLRMLETIGG